MTGTIESSLKLRNQESESLTQPRQMMVNQEFDNQDLLNQDLVNQENSDEEYNPLSKTTMGQHVAMMRAQKQMVNTYGGMCFDEKS